MLLADNDPHCIDANNEEQLQPRKCICDSIFTEFTIAKIARLIHAIDFLSGRLETSHIISNVSEALDSDWQLLAADEQQKLNEAARKYIENSDTLLNIIVDGYHYLD
jgi:hypothetical protein